jgi:hypothetical protein
MATSLSLPALPLTCRYLLERLADDPALVGCEFINTLQHIR